MGLGDGEEKWEKKSETYLRGKHSSAVYQIPFTISVALNRAAADADCSALRNVHSSYGQYLLQTYCVRRSQFIL